MNTEEYIEKKYIKTKNKYRKIITYKDGENILKVKHNKISEFVGNNYRPSIFAKGYIRNRSIIDNARAHMYNNYFIMFDVKDFFPSINVNLLTESLYRELSKTTEISKLECSDIVSLCALGDKGLPLGLITSPILSNVYMKQFDNILYGKLKKIDAKNIIYTRYADDITISVSETNDFDLMANLVENIVSEQLKSIGMKLNKKKTRKFSFDKSNHVKITGINITVSSDDYRNLTIGRKVKDQLFNSTLKYLESNKKNIHEELKIKGLESFVLAVEGKKYESCYSEKMINLIKERYKCNSLHDLISKIKDI